MDFFIELMSFKIALILLKMEQKLEKKLYPEIRFKVNFLTRKYPLS